MERITRFRAGILILLFALVLGFFAFTLYDLQVIETGGKTDNTTTFTTRTRVKAARGDILDRNGNVLVSNRASFDLAINHFVLITATGTNDYLYQLVQRCQANGIEYTENFPISKERPFVYTLEEQSSAWQGYFQRYLAFVGGLDSDITAPLLIDKLREYYGLPETLTDEEARLVIGLWYELDLRRAVDSLPLYVFISDAKDAHLSEIMELGIPGLNVEASTVREYNTKFAAHILGHTGAMTAKQWEHYKNVDGYAMDTVLGQSGLEEAFEEYLHGVDGLREDTVTVDGKLVSSRYIIEPKAGANVELTIDLKLQDVAETRMAALIESLRAKEPGSDGADAEGCAVVVMDVKTGRVLVCASYPTYDLANFSKDYNDILAAPYSPLFNRALQGAYPPGSTYKMSMVIAGIDSGAITADKEIVDRGRFDKYWPWYADCLAWSNNGTVHEHVNAAQALKVSCNYYFFWLADNMRISDIDATAKALGLGEKTGIELWENLGYRANPDTKALLSKGEDKVWYQGDQVLAGIGQSVNQFTPMQLCSYVSTLANRGTRYQATLLNRVVSSDYRSLLLESKASALSHLEISDEAYEAYTTGMKLVASESGGTAYRVFQNYPISIAAKTGTAETGMAGSDNGAFVCYAPAENPQIAIAIYGEKAGHGSTLASLAKAILDVYFEVGEIGDVNIYENGLS